MSTILIIIVSLAVVIYGISYFAAYRVIHQPRQPILNTPADYGLAYESFSCHSTDGIPLQGWWIPGENTAAIFVVHGYGANRAGGMGKNLAGEEEYLDWLAAAPALHEAGYNLVYFDLRACGKSGGSTITLGKEEANDLVGVINWIMANKQAKDGQALNGIGLLGMSMWGNVALRGAIQLQETFVDNLAVVSIGAYRYDTMVEKSIKFWTALPDFFIPFIKHAAKQQLGFDPSTEIDPARYVGQIDATPVIYIQAEKDEIGDLADARAIFQQATDPKELIILPDALRFDAYRYPAEHPEKILSFFADHILS